MRDVAPTPTISNLSRAIMNSEPRPKEWFVTPDTMARLKDEAKSIGARVGPEVEGVSQIVMLCGARIVEMGRDAI